MNEMSAAVEAPPTTFTPYLKVIYRLDKRLNGCTSELDR